MPTVKCTAPPQANFEPLTFHEDSNAFSVWQDSKLDDADQNIVTFNEAEADFTWRRMRDWVNDRRVARDAAAHPSDEKRMIDAAKVQRAHNEAMCTPEKPVR